MVLCWQTVANRHKTFTSSLYVALSLQYRWLRLDSKYYIPDTVVVLNVHLIFLEIVGLPLFLQWIMRHPLSMSWLSQVNILGINIASIIGTCNPLQALQNNIPWKESFTYKRLKLIFPAFSHFRFHSESFHHFYFKFISLCWRLFSSFHPLPKHFLFHQIALHILCPFLLLTTPFSFIL